MEGAWLRTPGACSPIVIYNSKNRQNAKVRYPDTVDGHKNTQVWKYGGNIYKDIIYAERCIEEIKRNFLLGKNKEENSFKGSR